MRDLTKGDNPLHKRLEEEAMVIAEKIRKSIYDMWVQSRKSSRLDFGHASYQSFVRDAIKKEWAAFAAPYVEKAERAKADADKCAESAEIFRKRVEQLERDLAEAKSHKGCIVCEDAQLELSAMNNQIGSLGFEVETKKENGITEHIWHNRRAEAAEKRLAQVERDIEQGFMKGAYARLQELQDAEKALADYKASQAGLKCGATELWTACADKLPAPDSKEYLVWDEGWGSQYHAFFDEDGWGVPSCHEAAVNITHWRMLPHPPIQAGAKPVIEEVRKVEWPDVHMSGDKFDVLGHYADGWNACRSRCIAAYNAARRSPAPGMDEIKKAWAELRIHIWESDFDESDYGHTDYTRAVMALDAALASYEPLKPWQAISTKSEQSKGPLASQQTNKAEGGVE